MSGPGSGRRRLVSVCMIVKNEARFIARSIQSSKDVADEILVGDTGSTDDTVAIARIHGATVFDVPWTDDFAAAKNAVLARARGRWIVFVDGDEWFLPRGAQTLRNLLKKEDQNPLVAAVSVFQSNLLSLETPHVQDRSRTIRVFRNRPEHRYVFPIHEQIAPNLRGAVIATNLELMHAGFTREVLAEKNKSQRNQQLLDRMMDRTDPKNPHYVYLLMQHGREHHRQGRLLEAEDDLMRAAMLFWELGQQGLVEPSPFASVLFAYLAEVLLQRQETDRLLMMAERLKPYIPFPQADRAFFLGMAHHRRQEWESAAAAFLEAMACLEGAPQAQEYMSMDRTVLTYSGAAQSLLALNRVADALSIVITGVKAQPDRKLLGDTLMKVLTCLPARDGVAVLDRLPKASWPTVAHSALEAGLDEVCLEASARALQAGDVGALPWAAAMALKRGQAAEALQILAEIPHDHPSQALVTRLRAMAHFKTGDMTLFRDTLAQEPDPYYRAGLSLWADEPLSDFERAQGEVGLKALIAVMPLPEPSFVLHEH